MDEVIQPTLNHHAPQFVPNNTHTKPTKATPEQQELRWQTQSARWRRLQNDTQTSSSSTFTKTEHNHITICSQNSQGLYRLRKNCEGILLCQGLFDQPPECVSCGWPEETILHMFQCNHPNA